MGFDKLSPNGVCLQQDKVWVPVLAQWPVLVCSARPLTDGAAWSWMFLPGLAAACCSVSTGCFAPLSPCAPWPALLGRGLGGVLRLGGRRRQRQRRIALGVEIGDDVRPVLGLGQAGEGHLGARARSRAATSARRTDCPRSRCRPCPTAPTNKRSRSAAWRFRRRPRPRDWGRCRSGRLWRRCGRRCIS